MLTDTCGCQVSITDARALDAWNGVIHAVLSHGQAAPHHLGILLDREPGFAMGHALKGLSALMLARRELLPAAKTASDAAQAALTQGGATLRERVWCQALVDWLKGAPRKSVEAMEEALRLNPADTISMKLGHGIRFILGDNHGMLRSVEATLAAHGRDHPLRGYVLGCHAFALEETGAYCAAERTGLLALRYASDDAWGLHAVAHVYDMTHRTDRGIALIDDNAAAWDHCNNFRFHVWWHKALLHLDQRDYATVLDLYDTKIRDEHTDDFRDISNATSLLMRLELEGVSIGNRWEELATLSANRTQDGCLVFADLHYMLALVGDGRETAVQDMINRVARDAERMGETFDVVRDPGVAATRGLAAFGEGNYGTAFDNLFAAHPRFQAMGGSHAQRDIFERITIDAGIRAGRLEQVELVIRQRTARRAGVEDAFAASRMSTVSAARQVARAYAAE
ncbi:MAG: tetratricopeptide repeat protein [Marinovum sp.]|nr:tetratricopeptide repeat protein [Marinovum sp.]